MLVILKQLFAELGRILRCESIGGWLHLDG